jgi:hypothetical protein
MLETSQNFSGKQKTETVIELFNTHKKTKI